MLRAGLARDAVELGAIERIRIAALIGAILTEIAIDEASKRSAAARDQLLDLAKLFRQVFPEFIAAQKRGDIVDVRQLVEAFVELLGLSQLRFHHFDLLGQLADLLDMFCDRAGVEHRNALLGDAECGQSSQCCGN
jgi:hypothetical protein